MQVDIHSPEMHLQQWGAFPIIYHMEMQLTFSHYLPHGGAVNIIPSSSDDNMEAFLTLSSTYWLLIPKGPKFK